MTPCCASSRRWEAYLLSLQRPLHHTPSGSGSAQMKSHVAFPRPMVLRAPPRVNVMRSGAQYRALSTEHRTRRLPSTRFRGAALLSSN